jgi:predicted HTH domain antitoxin
MAHITLDFDPSAFAVLRKSPEEFAAEVKTAAVVQWYAEGRVSQSKACELLGISRTAFLAELHHRRVPACQVDIDDLDRELRGG